MNARIVERLLWGATLGMSVLTMIAWTRAVAELNEPKTESPDVPGEVTSWRQDSLEVAASIAAENDVFRVTRQPSPVAYRSETDGAAPPPSRPPRPTLLLTGVVGGPPWEAVLEGVPNREGSVLVHAGDTLSGLRVRAIRRDEVTIAGMDTIWTLTVRRAW